MSKKKDCCCCMHNDGLSKGILGCNNGILEAILFWLIACGAGLLNNKSILIILLFLLYGWSSDNNNLFGM